MPETHHLKTTSSVPNNTLPVLVYHDVLPSPVNSASAQAFLERNHWIKKGFVGNQKRRFLLIEAREWGAITTKHFHPNTHECYGIIAGNSTMRLGAGDDDLGETGVLIELRVGDVIVVPAGVSHHSVERGNGEFRYIGVYPEGAPKWRNLYGKGEENLDDLKVEIQQVGIPAWDPVEGEGGSLTKFWAKVLV